MSKPLSLAQRSLIVVLIILVCVAIDQWTKAIAKSLLTLDEAHFFLGDIVRFQLAHNTGAFLSLGAWLPESVRYGLLTIGVGVLLVALLAYAFVGKELDRFGVLALALIFAGGASNLGDRIVYGGYVVDFVQIGIGWLRTGVFNVADMAIMAGTFMLLFDVFRKRTPETAT